MISELIKNKRYTYKLFLHKINYEYIMPLKYTKISFTRKFNDYDELSVAIPQKTTYRENESRKTTDNPAWDKAVSGGIILMRIYDGEDNVFNEYFSISDFSLSSSQNEKELSCVAAHQILFNRLLLNGYDQIRKLYEYTDSYQSGVKFDTKDDSAGGILNYIIEYKLFNENYSSSNDFWKVTYYDESLNDIFDNNAILKSDLESLRTNIAYYWHISRRYDDYSTYTGNVPTVTEDGTPKQTVKKWADKFGTLLSPSYQL